MKKNLFYLALVIFISANYGCRKNIFSNRIEGEVLGQMTKQPLSGAKVYLVRKIITGNLLGNYQYETVQIAETDPNGKFNMVFRQQDNAEYKLYARKEGYYDEQSITGVTSYKEISPFAQPFKKKITLYLNEPGYVNLTFRNVSQFPDSLFIEIWNYRASLLILKKCSSENFTLSKIKNSSKEEIIFNYTVFDKKENKVTILKQKGLSLPPPPPYGSVDYVIDY